MNFLTFWDEKWIHANFRDNKFLAFLIKNLLKKKKQWFLLKGNKLLNTFEILHIFLI